MKVGKLMGFAILALGSFYLAGCPSNNPSSPNPAPGPTATPSMPSASVSFTTTGTSPNGIRYASGGYLWIVDTGNNKLQKWTTAGAAALTITTYNGGATFYSPWSLGVDPSTGNVFVADNNNDRIDAFTSIGGYINNFGSSQFTSGVQGVAINSAGSTIYGSGYSPSGIFTFTPGASSTYNYQTEFGNSGSGATNDPIGECFDSQGNLWVTDYRNYRVVEYNGSGVYQTAVTLASGGKPLDVAVDNYGNLFATDGVNYEIQEFNAAGQHLYNFYATGQPSGITLDPTSTYLYLADMGNARVVTFKIH